MSLLFCIVKTSGLRLGRWLLGFCLVIWLQPQVGTAAEGELSSNSPALVALTNLVPEPLQLSTPTNAGVPVGGSLVTNFNTGWRRRVILKKPASRTRLSRS